MIAQFQPVYPTSDLLKDHIYCYYTVRSTDPDFRSIHYSFPHIFNAVSIYQGASFDGSEGNLKIEGGSDQKPFCILQGKRQRPLLVDLEGAFSRVTILFKPLGLNYFIDAQLDDLMTADPSLFHAWDGLRFDILLDDLFDEKDPPDQIYQLEKFLEASYRPFDQPALKQALTLLDDFDNDRSIDDIAAEVGLSLRTFNRLFKAHLGVSPVTHQRIARFRHSLENKLFSDKFKKLTEIGYQSNFYDQSYFIKLYNQLAGSNPGALFRKLEQLGDSKLVFEFK